MYLCLGALAYAGRNPGSFDGTTYSDEQAMAQESFAPGYTPLAQLGERPDSPAAYLSQGNTGPDATGAKPTLLTIDSAPVYSQHLYPYMDYNGMYLARRAHELAVPNAKKEFLSHNFPNRILDALGGVDTCVNSYAFVPGRAMPIGYTGYLDRVRPQDLPAGTRICIGRDQDGRAFATIRYLHSTRGAPAENVETLFQRYGDDFDDWRFASRQRRSIGDSSPDTLADDLDQLSRMVAGDTVTSNYNGRQLWFNPADTNTRGVGFCEEVDDTDSD